MNQVARSHVFPIVFHKVARLALRAVETHEVNSHVLTVKALHNGLEDSLLPFVKYVFVAEAGIEHKLTQTRINWRGYVRVQVAHYV